MFSKLLLGLALFCFVQAIQAETAEEVIEEIKPKLNALRVKVDATIHEGGITIGQAHSNLQLIINEAEVGINQRLSNLNKAVEQAKNEANANGKNIEQCITQEKLAVQNLNRKGLELCRNDNQLNLLSQKLGELGTLKAVIGSAPQSCKSQSVNDVAKLRSCLENVITVVDNQLGSVSQEIDDTIESVEENARECAKTNANEINSGIAQISSDFTDCVNNS